VNFGGFICETTSSITVFYKLHFFTFIHNQWPWTHNYRLNEVTSSLSL